MKSYSDHAYSLLKGFYMLEEEKTPSEAFMRASRAWSGGDEDLADRLFEYVSNNWFMFASPVLSNAPKEGQHTKAMPISCFLNFVPDSISGLISHTEETRWLSVLGGGVGGHWSSVRDVSGIAPGPIPFMHTVDADMVAYQQGKTRKGSYAAYMDISHPSIVEFIEIRIPTGDADRKCLNIHNAVNIPDAFMKAVEEDDDWQLVDPHTKEVRDTIKARLLWSKILETRFRTGEPYIHFIDTTNRALNYYQRSQGLTVKGSNLCSEITLVTDEKRTAVCCLSSLNMEKYDEWKDTTIVEDLVTMLDNILDYFIANAPPQLARAVYSAKRERSIGLGAMGFHSYLQSRNIPFESQKAREVNVEMFTNIYIRAAEQSMRLGKERGEPDDLKGSGWRNAHLIAIAPNANSSIISGCSPSIEPWAGNAFTHKTRVGSHLIKNKYLEKVLDKHGKNNDETWSSIIGADGSVQHLSFLTDYERLVFKTAREINQEWVVLHAGDRQQFICQAQSVNLFFPSGADRCYVHNVHYNAWKRGLKTLYYLRTKSAKSAETISNKIERVPIPEGDECIACHA